MEPDSKLPTTSVIDFNDLPNEVKVTSEDLENFSNSNGMQYVAENKKLWKTRRMHKGIIYPQHTSDGLPAFNQAYKDIIYLSVQGLPSVIYTSSDLVGRKSSTTLSVIFPDFLPTLIIKPKKRSSPLLDLGIINSSKEKPVRKLTLEGDFSNDFTVYSDGQYAIEALTILGPDFMLLLQQEIGNYNIVIFRNNLSINIMHSASKDSYVNLLQTADKIIAPIKKEIMNLNVLALNEREGIDNLMSAEPGLRRNRKAGLIGLSLVTVCSVILMFITGNALFALIISWCVFLWLLAGFIAVITKKSAKLRH